MDKQYKHWKLNTKENQILWVYFDKENQVVNTFSVDALMELSDIIQFIADNEHDFKGVIFTSAKKSGFIAGADIEQFTKVQNETEAYDFVSKAHDIFNRIEALKLPTLALINGVCLGGGLEMALSCQYRIAKEDAKTRLGLPEVMLGIFPGWGGSVRLPRLIGAVQAMGLMLTGRTVDAKKAERMGFVDAAVPERHLEKAAESFILNPTKQHQATRLQTLTNNSFVRKLLAKKMRKQLASFKLRKEHYPAPYALVDNWEQHGVSKAAFDGEAKAVSRLVMTDSAQNLIRVFFLQQRLKSLGKGVDFKPKHVHVIGAGTMGGDIAAWCALRGMTVTLQDREAKYIAPAIKRAASLYKKKLKKDYLVQAVLDRLIPDVEGNGVPVADVVIEAIFENCEVKQKLFKDLENRMKSDAIMATNTSSIPLDEINTVLDKPERLVGIHFFNPVAKMQLVEIVVGAKTSDEVAKKAQTFVRAIDRLPLPVKSHPGFLVNRVLMPYLMESLVLMQDGVPMQAIDKAALAFGMPMGPVELSDKVGLDICLNVAQNLAQYFDTEVPKLLIEKVESKELGVKTGKGFYQYDSKGKLIKPEYKNSPLSPELIQQRLINRYLNEAMACIREGIVADMDLLDAGMIFGTGFAPFRGGPLHYAKHLSFETVQEQLKTLTEKFGERFTPDVGWASAE